MKNNSWKEKLVKTVVVGIGTGLGMLVSAFITTKDEPETVDVDCEVVETPEEMVTAETEEV